MVPESARRGVGELRRMLNDATRVVAFTGAGISTESGIPDFRSPGGLWNRYQPIPFDAFLASEEMRRESWRRKIAIDEAIAGFGPNQGHQALAELGQRGKLSSVITQNIDGLHQRSGLASSQVIELHGNGTYARCLDCEKRYELKGIVERFKRDEELPVCDECGGIIKSATISFGQAMPRAAMDRAEAETLACDLFLAVGSSLVVHPAAGFPALARRNGARLVILNREPTPLDSIADLILRFEIGETLASVVEVD